ncbi:MAG TPA: CcmD family protein [Longimicrobiales bacterium]|nr:CcmD family protein [Longimicrobiales bacterium]
MSLSNRLLRWALPVLLALLVSVPLLAQEGMPVGGATGQNLRAYRFVFLAYAILWVLVFGWVASVGRRLAKLERRLGE